MCAHCLDASTEEFLRTTGIHPKSLDILDDLVVAALNMGEMMREHSTVVEGDPLKRYRQAVVLYIAAMELKLRETGFDPITLLPTPVLQMGPAPELLS